ncbi:response regulator transcription factor [Chloroflexota bacterium]
MGKDIRILIVDDHEVVREGLRRLLEQEKDMRIMGTCANGKEALIMAAVRSPNIVLMDIRMPIVNGLEATHLLSESRLFCKVIILSMYGDYLAEAMQSGARGYLVKGMKRGELAQAIRQVHRGELVISESITSKPQIDVVNQRNGTLPEPNTSA